MTQTSQPSDADLALIEAAIASAEQAQEDRPDPSQITTLEEMRELFRSLPQAAQEPAATVQPVESAWVALQEIIDCLDLDPAKLKLIAVRAMCAAPQPQAAQTEREAEIRARALEEALAVAKRNKDLATVDGIRAISHQPAQDGQRDK